TWLGSNAFDAVPHSGVYSRRGVVAGKKKLSPLVIKPFDGNDVTRFATTLQWSTIGVWHGLIHDE
ncbi:MAG TPA: hypothetical protein PLN21_00450, partial [Gemmatales bacterium]|nr:hypothetical protein [Gemmatales bacterium]